MVTLILFLLICSIVLGISLNIDLEIFNPIRNYNEWDNLNWLGIFVITLLLNIIFIPYAIGYWIYKLFTIGRK